MKHNNEVIFTGGANSSDDVSRPGVVHVSEGVSSYDIMGIKYCPGGELPKYEYVEYKPRCSKSKRTTFEYVQDRCKPEIQVEQEMDVSTQPRQDEANMIVYEPEEGRNLVNTEAHFLSVRERIEDWDRLNSMEEVMETAKEVVSTARRSSDRFRRLAGCFEKSAQGVEGESELSELSGANFKMAENTHSQFPRFSNFTDILAQFSPGGVKKHIKIPRLRQQKLRVGREGSILLDDRSTNGKRVFASVGNYRDYPGFEDRSNKKLKVSPL